LASHQIPSEAEEAAVKCRLLIFSRGFLIPSRNGSLSVHIAHTGPQCATKVK
jgi:hypothetical protein